MCGFAGFVEFDQSHATCEDLLSMQKAIKHRGPDGILGMADMSTMQESLEMRAPYFNNRIMECALHMPFKLKYSRGELRALLKAVERQWGFD